VPENVFLLTCSLRTKDDEPVPPQVVNVKATAAQPMTAMIRMRAMVTASSRRCRRPQATIAARLSANKPLRIHEDGAGLWVSAVKTRLEIRQKESSMITHRFTKLVAAAVLGLGLGAIVTARHSRPVPPRGGTR
jgi:hypothetical protein